MTCRSDRGRSASAVDLRHGFLVYRYFMTAPMLFSRIRGVKVGYSVKVEREVGTGGSPAREPNITAHGQSGTQWSEQRESAPAARRRGQKVISFVVP